MSRAEMEKLGWDQCDCIVVTGDAYVDHPSFGAAVIARVLLDAGFRTGVIAQPYWTADRDFLALGRPRLFFGVTAGNVDSMVANYSSSLQRRKEDDYSPGGRVGMRPNRATIVYSNKLRQLFKQVPLVLGGVEASLRRLAHYDYWDNAVRGSVLLDARADILVYGMGERQVVEIARRLDAEFESDTGHRNAEETKRASEREPSAVRRTADLLAGILGTCVSAHGLPVEEHVLLPSFEQVRENKDRFNEAFRLWYREADNPQGRVVVQQHADRYVVQYPVPEPMSQAELDRVYDLPYARQPHPRYTEKVPALETVKFSITSHRGCLGSCSFCSLRPHQGRIIQSRSRDSILREARAIVSRPEFRGHITDIGGPTANMYGATCPKMKQGKVCTEQECTFPQRCASLRVAYESQLEILEAVRRLPGVKQVSIGTGIRFDLLDGPGGETYLQQLCEHYVSGQMRVAPEHVSPQALAMMRKFSAGAYDTFRRRFFGLTRALSQGRPRLYLIPYYISGHPGTTVDDAVELAEYLVRVERFFIRQVQQFTPLPMTAAGAAYFTGKDPLTGKSVHVARTAGEKRLQRALLQLHEPRNLVVAEQELSRMGRQDLLARVRRLKPMLRPSGGGNKPFARVSRARPQ